MGEEGQKLGPNTKLGSIFTAGRNYEAMANSIDSICDMVNSDRTSNTAKIELRPGLVELYESFMEINGNYVEIDAELEHRIDKKYNDTCDYLDTIKEKIADEKFRASQSPPGPEDDLPF